MALRRGKIGTHGGGGTQVDNTIWSGTAAEWAADGRVLGAGVPGYVTDTLTFVVGDGVTAASSLSAAGSSTYASTAALADKADKTTSVTAGTGLTGGGDLSTSRTLTVAYGTASGTAAQGNDSRIVGAAADSAVVHLTGTETVAGVKTFSSSPVVPTPTTSGQVATKGYVDTHVLPSPEVHAADYGVVGDSDGTAGNGTDNTTGMRNAYAAALLLTTTVTGQDWCYAKIILPDGVIRITGTIVDQADAAGATVIPVRGLAWEGKGRRATEVFFDRAGSTTEDPRLNTAFILGNRAIGWSFTRMSFRSLDVDNSLFYLWCRDTDDTVTVAFPEYGRGAQSDFHFGDVEWRGQWKRIFGLAGDHQSNLNSELQWDRCSVSTDATFADAFCHIGMPMYGAVHMRVTGGATGGDFTITVGANTTSAIAYNASAATIQTAVTGLASVGSGNATVTAVSDGFMVRFLNGIESIDTTTVSVTPALTGGSSPTIVMMRRPIQGSQFLNYWATNCRFEYGGGVFFRFGRGGNMNCVGGSYIGVAGTITFFKMEDEPSHADGTLRLWVAGVRFEIRTSSMKVIDCKWNKGFITFDSITEGFSGTHSTHVYDFTTQSLSRGPQIVYRSCELQGNHSFTTHGSTAVSGGGVYYEDCRFMQQSAATGSGSGMARYSGVAIPYEVRRCHGSSFTRITNSMFGFS